MFGSKAPVPPLVALAAAALLLSPAPGAAQAAAQATPEAHEVVEGNTLWDLAVRFYGDGHAWHRIWEANRDRVEDPDLIYPGTALRIPDPVTGEVREVTVVAPGDAPAPAAQDSPAAADEPEPITDAVAAEPEEAPVPLTYRTRMYPDTAVVVTLIDEALLPPPVSRDQVWSAPWLAPLDEAPAVLGSLTGFEGAEGALSGRVAALPYDDMLVRFEGTDVPPAGTALQAFRAGRALEDGRGRVWRPTGVLEVVQRDAAGGVARVRKLYDQMVLGDLVRLAPAYPLGPGARATAMDGTAGAEIVGFADARRIYSIGDVAFLDVGSESGARIGDEYTVVWSSGPGWSGEAEGRLRVVAVEGRHASVRIFDVENPVFTTGVRLLLVGRILE